MLRNSRAYLGAIAFGILLSACSHDPNLRKQEYLKSDQQFFQQGKYQDAAIQFRNALQTDPRFAAAHYELARCYLKLEAWNSPYSELLRAAELDPSNRAAQIEMGKLFVMGREYNRARDKADLLLRQNPQDIDAHVIGAQALAGLGDSADAGQEIQEALRIDPQRASTHLEWARIEVKTG